MSNQSQNHQSRQNHGRERRSPTGTPLEEFLDVLARAIAREHLRQQRSCDTSNHREKPR